MVIQEVLTAPRSPWKTRMPNVHRIRATRECLDHVIIFSAMGLQRLMKLYCTSYEQSRTHLSLNKDAPIHRPIAARGDGRVVAIPQVGDCITSTNAKRPDRVCSSHSHQPESVLAETANDRDRDRRRRSPFRKDN